MSRQSRAPLRSLEFITLRIKDAACDKFRAQTGSRPSVDTVQPDVRIHAFLDAERFTIYLDTSGEPLFKRGSRQIAGEAPLRENLAAGILKLAGWTPGTPLLDPMCGSGTLLIEAAQIARGIPPGHRRGFAFENLRGFDAQLWASIRADADAHIGRMPRRQFSGAICSETRSSLRARTWLRQGWPMRPYSSRPTCWKSRRRPPRVC